MKLQRNLWLLVIPVLLLATGLASQRLSHFPLDVNEEASKFLAGGTTDGPYSFTEVLDTIRTVYPDQAYGLPLVYSVWGRLFGWSEFPLRLLPLFAGLLALAWVYRTGQEWFGPLAGVVAVLLLATSVFFITFMHVARAFSLIAMFVTMVTWSYRRIALRTSDQGVGWGTQLIFVLGSVGILYSHYYAAFYLVGLSLLHLLLLSKSRQWWHPVLLWGVSTILFLPQLRGLLLGVDFTQTQPWFTSADMRASEVYPWFLYVLSNGIVKIGKNFSILTFILIILVTVVSWRSAKRQKPISRMWILAFTILTVLVLMLIGNEILLVMKRYRIRYFMALWPLIALLVGGAVWRSRGRWSQVASILIGVWFVFGLWVNTATNARYEVYSVLNFRAVHPVSLKIVKHVAQTDLLIVSDHLNANVRTSKFYFISYPDAQIEYQNTSDFQSNLATIIHSHLRIWLMANLSDQSTLQSMKEILPIEMMHCGSIVHKNSIVLELYTRSSAHCQNEEQAAMRFGEEIELVASEIETISEEILQVDLLLHSEENIGMTAYSVALHVFDAESGAKVAQGDQGLWVGRYNPLRSEIDISGLMAGEYELRVGVYNWQTLERLEGVDLTSGATAFLLTLYRFRVE